MGNDTKKKVYIGVIIFALLLIGTAVGLYLVQQQQNTQQDAAEPELDLNASDSAGLTPTITTIPTPACFDNVASCKWDSLTGAESYSYKVTKTSDGSIIKEGTVDGTIKEVEFDIDKNVTYKCEVSAVNACGAGTPAAATQACTEVPPTATGVPPTATGVPPSPTNIPPTATDVPPSPTKIPPTPIPPTKIPPTSVPPAIIQPTSVPQQRVVIQPTSVPQQVVVVTQPPQPTIEPTGTTEVIIGAIGGILVAVIGALLFFAL